MGVLKPYMLLKNFELLALTGDVDITFSWGFFEEFATSWGYVPLWVGYPPLPI